LLLSCFFQLPITAVEWENSGLFWRSKRIKHQRPWGACQTWCLRLYIH
jgi:hypothetical protein